MGGAISIKHIAQAFLPHPPKVIAVLYAYVDETGFSGATTATIVGGLIGTLDHWLPLETRWRARLAEDGISEFHATKCRGGHGEYHAWRPDWSRMEQHYSNLAAIATDYKLRPISGTVLSAAWKRASSENEWLVNRFVSAYGFCFEICLMHIQIIATEFDDQAYVVYALNPQYADRAETVGRVYERNIKYFDRITSCAPARPVEVIPLQAADMAAYEMYHLFHSQKNPKRPKLELMPLLGCSGQPNGYYYNYDGLQTLVRKGAPSLIDLASSSEQPS